MLKGLAVAIVIVLALGTVAFADSIARKIEKGSDVSEEEYSLYNECKNTFVSESEEALFDEYLDALRTVLRGQA